MNKHAATTWSLLHSINVKIPILFIIYINQILYVYCTYIILLYVYYTDIIRILYVYYVHIIYILYIYYVYIICILCVYYMYIIRILCVYYMYLCIKSLMLLIFFTTVWEKQYDKFLVAITITFSKILFNNYFKLIYIYFIHLIHNTW